MSAGPTRVPPRRLGHETWRRGYFVNSSYGSERMAHLGKNWVDNDGHLSAPNEHGQCAWIRAHGTPEQFWLPRGDRFENHTWEDLSKRHRRVRGRVYSLDNARQALIDNHRAGLGTEWDVKNVHPWDTEAILDDAMARFARHAEDVYGEHWRDFVNVKVLTTWGLPYALKICAAAHKHGIPTLLSVRGRHRFNRFTGHEEITYVRGSAVIR